MQTKEARSFSRKIKNQECVQNKQIFYFSNWLNFLNTVWINKKQINQTKTEPFCSFPSMDYGLCIRDLWMSFPCKLMERSWESASTSLSHLLGYHKLCILFLSRLNALYILNIYIYIEYIYIYTHITVFALTNYLLENLKIKVYLLFLPLCLVFMEHHISFFFNYIFFYISFRFTVKWKHKSQNSHKSSPQCPSTNTHIHTHHTHTAFPIINIPPTRVVHLLKPMTLHWHITVTRSPGSTLRLTLGGMHSMSLDKHLKTSTIMVSHRIVSLP